MNCWRVNTYSQEFLIEFCYLPRNQYDTPTRTQSIADVHTRTHQRTMDCVHLTKLSQQGRFLLIETIKRKRESLIQKP